jgi:hypothetical protein
MSRWATEDERNSMPIENGFDDGGYAVTWTHGEDRRASCDQMLWTRPMRKAAYLPG